VAPLSLRLRSASAARDRVCHRRWGKADAGSTSRHRNGRLYQKAQRPIFRCQRPCRPPQARWDRAVRRGLALPASSLARTPRPC